ncbi:monothiol glutaredoxin-S2-like protein [Tanacetum coccineum]
MDTVTKMVSEIPVVIFSVEVRMCVPKTFGSSGMCVPTNLKVVGSSLAEGICELDEIPNGRQVEQSLLKLGRNPIIPAVFIGGEYAGGANEITSLHLQRSLQPMLKNAGALWV